MSNSGGSEGRTPIGRHVNIAPASLPTASSSMSSTDADVNALSGQPTAKIPRRTVTAVACTPCKGRKSKCDGERPVCQACIRRGEQEKCHFDVNNDQRRTAALKEKVGDLKKEGDKLKQIIAVLNTKVDPEHPYNPLVHNMIENQFSDLDEVADRMVQEEPATLIRYGLLEPEQPSRGETSHPLAGGPPGGPPPKIESQPWGQPGPPILPNYALPGRPAFPAGPPIGPPQPMEPRSDVVMQYDSDRRPPEGYQPSQHGYYPLTSRPWLGPS